MLRTQIARCGAEVDRLRSTWEYLTANSRSATLFQSFTANRLAADRFADRESPFVVLAESDAGAALIPAAIARNRLTILGESLFDYRDVLALGDADVLRAAWSRLSVLGLPISLTALRGSEAYERWGVFCPEPFVTAGQVLRKEIGTAEFERQHGRLKRRLRQLSREGFDLRHYTRPEARLIAGIYQQKAQQIDGPESVFRDPSRREFMVALCIQEAMRCEVFALESPTAVAAAIVTFRDRQVRRFYTIWFDRQWAKYSPGTALLFEVTRRSLEEGLDCDYMTGEQPHKLRFQTSSVPLFRVNAGAQLVEAAAGDAGAARDLVSTQAGAAGQNHGAASVITS